MKTIAEFNEIIKTQDFVDFEYKFMPLCEIKNGQFFRFNGAFFQANGSQDTELRVAKKVGNGETKYIPNVYKVSAVINY